MTISFGGIDMQQIFHNEFEILYLKNLINWLIDNNPHNKRPTMEIFDRLRERAFVDIQLKYPQLKLELRKPGENPPKQGGEK